MSIDTLFDRASSVMTVLSFATFIGILLWTFLLRRGADFDGAAALPFADEEAHHG
ncbi:cbb3-type cytochrome oxidase subunit 3 [Telluria aromaticivorans]|uniref:CcoQ/FixQ family Cbb3-type cytochrome c oxidase assembly chaperone n=1 Tax=Telluria aromaticivorans TaxID=2725995 RepID=A0A7Y2JY47_9BURK|nr:CcoQ/FixQ family Cbb3-type cytochrome c oxidase assembly chaperone [Telluria aromaticivorans]NNG22883.1 CcoQ/FixQ family Cbb3-type cytochrome c oxidase assembly chaperone [Telluria aromaticivorans]